MAKLLLSAFFVGVCLVPGLTSYPKDPSLDSGSYTIGDPAKLHETDALTDQLISYKIIPLNPAEVINSREKRQVQVIPEESDKSVLLKSNTGTKKPILNSKDTNNLNVTTTVTKSSQNDSNKTSSPVSDGSGNKSIVVDVVPAPTGNTPKPSKNFPKDKSTNITSGAGSTNVNKTLLLPTGSTTSAPLEIDDAHPTFPYNNEFSEDLKNATNVTRKIDHHKYYNSTYYSDGWMLWVNLDDHSETVSHDLLSDAHRRAATLKLPFDFPFYGHIVNNVTVATGGFLYLGEQVHAWLAATQYVAPLMANFDSRFSNASVRYLSNDNFFTVEWHEVRLQDAADRGSFTFQTSLQRNGSIVFAFKNIPFPVNEINDTHHPVKVGLSDAYISDRTILFVKQKTIYEYHRIDVTQYNITNGSAIIFTSLPTCLSYSTCEECTTHESNFECEWCPYTQRCSDGTDRYRQEWITRNCKTSGFKRRAECYASTVSPSPDIYHHNLGGDDHDTKRFHQPDAQEKKQSELQADSNNPLKVSTAEETHGMTAASVIGILFLIAVVFGSAGWVLYGYHNPHSPSGQILIKFRPSQWRSFRRGEARYTAASIHM